MSITVPDFTNGERPTVDQWNLMPEAIRALQEAPIVGSRRLDPTVAADGLVLANLNIAPVFNVKAYGAKGDGTTDDTPAINAAIQAVAATGGVVYFPQGSYLVRGSGTELLLVNRPASLRGDGAGASRIVVDATVPGTTDVVRIYNPGGSLLNNFVNQSVRGLWIVPASGTPARNTLVIDTTTATVSGLAVEDNLFGQIGGWGISVTNPTRTDGFFTSTIARNTIYGGINLERAGDSVNVLQNVITGTGTGVRVNLVEGSSQCLIQGNNITSTGGAIHVISGRRTKILNNNIENPHGNTSTNHALIDLDGVPGGDTPLCEVRGNFLGAQVTADMDCIRVNDTTGAIIEGNVGTYGGSGVGVRITAAAMDTHIGANYWQNTAWLDDSSSTPQTSMYSGVLAGWRASRGNVIHTAGFTDTGLTILDDSELRVVSTTSDTITVAAADASGTYTTGATVTTWNGAAIGPFDITAVAISGGLVTLTTSAPHGVTTGAAIRNTGIGYHALTAQRAGVGDTAIGYNAFAALTTADLSCAYGYQSAVNLTTGAYNTLYGGNTAPTLTTGNHNTLIGYAADVDAAGAAYRTVIGAGATGTADNSVTLGRSSDTTIIPGPILAGSTLALGNTAPSTALDAQGVITSRSAVDSTPSAPTEGIRFSLTGYDLTGRYHNSIYNSVGLNTDANLMQFRVGSGDSTQATVMSLMGTGAVGIGATEPAASAKLDITSTTKGVLLPRMTTTEKGAISSPAEGLEVYDLSLHKKCVFTGSTWETVTSA